MVDNMKYRYVCRYCGRTLYFAKSKNNRMIFICANIACRLYGKKQ